MYKKTTQITKFKPFHWLNDYIEVVVSHSKKRFIIHSKDVDQVHISSHDEYFKFEYIKTHNNIYLITKIIQNFTLLSAVKPVITII